ncbi:MAG: hypothetical protein R2865_07470 [Deinococcales bacterium]
MAVNARQGIVRVLDSKGNLQRTIGEIGMAEHQFFYSISTVDEDGNYYIIIFLKMTAIWSNISIKMPRCSVGSYGMKTREFLHPISLALGEASIYVLDNETQLVQHFDREGQFPQQFWRGGYGQGAFLTTLNISALGKIGLVYVLDYGNYQVQRFDALGNYQTCWG